jgi:hypothetical protein
VQEFIPSQEEQKLYDLVTAYLQRPTLYALPASQRQLMTLILRKLLASSTYAISDTFLGLAKKLEVRVKEASIQNNVTQPLYDDFDQMDEIVDEWEEESEDGDEEEKLKEPLTPEQLMELKEELASLRSFYELGKSIERNSKGDVLLTALRRGFAAAKDAQEKQGAASLQQKALIFTESRRTQDYLLHILEQTEFAGKLVLFNGSNNDTKSNAIYQRWLSQYAGTDKISGSPTADKRAALVDYFRHEAEIMIATEAAAEGINLQFCNLIVNYDLPWNPQRIEQRIGRCHRYGQKFDVVVVNFLNRKNAADQRVYDLLDQKFRLFDGVFGASDEVLGAVESGVDFEKRIASIYQKCRTSEQIEEQFDALQKELEDVVDNAKQTAREELLNNFDQEVIEKVKIESSNYLGRVEEHLWKLTKYALNGYAEFNDTAMNFKLKHNPYPEEDILTGLYKLGSRTEEANVYRLGSPLAQKLLEQAKHFATPYTKLVFDITGGGKIISILKPLVGKSGWVRCVKQSVMTFELEDHLLFVGLLEDGTKIDAAQVSRLFDLSATSHTATGLPSNVADQLESGIKHQSTNLIAEVSESVLNKSI